MEERQTCVLPKDILGVPSENSDIDKLSFRKVQIYTPSHQHVEVSLPLLLQMLNDSDI